VKFEMIGVSMIYPTEAIRPRVADAPMMLRRPHTRAPESDFINNE